MLSLSSTSEREFRSRTTDTLRRTARGLWALSETAVAAAAADLYCLNNVCRHERGREERKKNKKKTTNKEDKNDL